MPKFDYDVVIIGSGFGLECARSPEAQSRTQIAMKRGFQTRDAEMDLAQMVGELAQPSASVPKG